ncbi:damage-inducible protein DinB [Lysinibacillus telephonicus]|uniref:Damage-inducible protein DinB n=2 Tax=Lysinibacillus telephonicus TaxID=1714840 RepID=A0A3S0HLG1_9BACI|nr:damage-inducible protein DinB [Lysinibacillus telephonicus]
METIQKMFEHLNWANIRILKTLQNAEVENQEIIRLFSHILLAEKIWFTRLQGLDSSNVPIWTEVDLKVCSQLVEENQEVSTKFLSQLNNTDLDKIVFYKNSKGTEFKNTIREILTHIALHGQHHRGQINIKLRTDGIEPVGIDFITFVR